MALPGVADLIDPPEYSDGVEEAAWPDPVLADGDEPPPQLAAEQAADGTAPPLPYWRRVKEEQPVHSLYLFRLGAALKAHLEGRDPLAAEQESGKGGFPSSAATRLSRLPKGYALFTQVKGTRTDTYLCGLKGKRFRSPKEFIPHLIWLASDETHDNNNCTCTHCPKSAAASASDRKERKRDKTQDTPARREDFGGDEQTPTRVRSAKWKARDELKDLTVHATVVPKKRATDAAGRAEEDGNGTAEKAGKILHLDGVVVGVKKPRSQFKGSKNRVDESGNMKREEEMGKKMRQKEMDSKNRQEMTSIKKRSDGPIIRAAKVRPMPVPSDPTKVPTFWEGTIQQKDAVVEALMLRLQLGPENVVLSPRDTYWAPCPLFSSFPLDVNVTSKVTAKVADEMCETARAYIAESLKRTAILWAYQVLIIPSFKPSRPGATRESNTRIYDELRDRMKAEKIAGYASSGNIMLLLKPAGNYLIGFAVLQGAIVSWAGGKEKPL